MYLLLQNTKSGNYFVKYERYYSPSSGEPFIKNVKRCGCFGRSDFANIWRDFYNKKINNKELTKKLESITV